MWLSLRVVGMLFTSEGQMGPWTTAGAFVASLSLEGADLPVKVPVGGLKVNRKLFCVSGF